MSQELQEEEESSQGQVDQGLPQDGRQGALRRSSLRVREETERPGQIQQTTLGKDRYELLFLTFYFLLFYFYFKF